jgi:class 3 adenylate cyclase
MDFDAILAQVREQLEQQRRLAYRIVKRRFELTDDDIEDLKADLIDAKQVARDENGKVLVWVGDEKLSGEEESQDIVSRFPVLAKDQRLPPKAPDAERHQLTVMFCDLVGSTTLSEQLDPEDLRDIIRAYQAACRDVIERYTGYIAQYLGDGLLVYFGYPAAHEDDARWAVQAGFEILSQIQSGSFSVLLQVRIGIHTGLVVVGEMGGAGKTEQLALGETPNVAARVQGQAEPNTVAISSVTYHLVQGFFDCRSLVLGRTLIDG